MTSLRVRRPDFRIDAGVPFQWQPANPAFGLFGNTFTLLAVAFEIYIVAAMRQAMPRITDPAILDEADAFLRQEAQHARAHRQHANAMIAQHPGLAETFASATAAFESLLEREDVDFHLAYIANLEATFTPLFKVVLDHRQRLFAGADERVGTLLLWHFVEEIEHRSSALLIHHHVTPDRWYRIRRVRQVFAHVTGLFTLILDGIERHVPPADRRIGTDALRPWGLWFGEFAARLPVLRRRQREATILGQVPSRDLRIMLRHLARSQTPRHDPAREPLPAWAREWHAAYDGGADITTYAGARL